MNKVQMFLCVVVFTLTLTVFIGISESPAMAHDNAAVVTEFSCGKTAQEFIENEQYKLAVSSLKEGLLLYPKSDWLYSMLGRAYFKMGDLDSAETQFRHALEINKNNAVAKRLIVDMRKTQDLLKDRDLYEWVGIAKEKAADLATLVIGVWLGMLLSSISGRVYSYFVSTSFRKALRKKDFEYATDILEDLVVDRKKVELRKRLSEFLHEFNLEEAKGLILEYVDDQEIKEKLVHFIVLIHKKSKICS